MLVSLVVGVMIMAGWMTLKWRSPQTFGLANTTSVPLPMRANPVGEGWPFPALLDNAHIDTIVAPGQTVWPTPIVDPTSPWYSSPYLPIWWGLIADTLVYSVAAGLLGFVLMHRRLHKVITARASHGRCVQCRYFLDRATTCPECGFERQESSLIRATPRD